KRKNQTGDLILPIAAIRGEGTSNDYLPPDVVPVVNQIRIYWWCSPPRTGRQRMCPVRSTARKTGVSFSKDRCVRTSLYNTTTERPRDRGVRASLSVASLGRMPGPYS